MESSIRGISIFGKLSWGMLGHGKTIIHSSNGNICLCLFLVVSHPLFYVAGYVMPLCRHSIAFTICLRDRQTANPVLNRWYLVMCIAVWWWSVYAAVCAAFWVNFKYCTATYQSFASTLASDNGPCGRNSVGALDSALLFSFWSLCFSFSAAASSFVEDSIKMQ